MKLRTQTSMRLKQDTLNKLKILKNKKGLSMARVLALVVDKYLEEPNEELQQDKLGTSINIFSTKRWP
mgnify:FL=1